MSRRYMEQSDFNKIKWAFQTLSIAKIERMFLKSENLNKFLTEINIEIENYKTLRSKRATKKIVDSAAYDKILKIKEISPKLKSYRRRNKSTKAKILEHFAEITALRCGGTYNGKEIPKCTWYEILLFLKSKGINTTETYIRHMYTKELSMMKDNQVE